MNSKIEAIKRNDTWKLNDLPTWNKKIEINWVYKTKLNKNGKLDKYKTRLVAKGYT